MNTNQSAVRTHFRRVLFCGIVSVGLSLVTSAVLAQTNSRAQWRREAALRVHDPSTLVREGDVYWMFCTGVGVSSFSSTNLLNWRPGPKVLPEMPNWVKEVVPDQRGHYWAPDLVRVADRWHLYYSVSSFGKNTSAIALATTPTLNPDSPDFKWKDEGIVIQSGRTNSYNTIDPAVIQDGDGRLWLAFGSYWSGIKLIELDPETGKKVGPAAPLYSLASNDNIEAAFLHRRGTNYFLFVNWGQCCKGVDSTYEIRVGRSDRITGPYRDRAGIDMLGGGGTLILGSNGRFVGPGHAGIVTQAGQEWLSYHYYDRENRGRPTLGMIKLSWDKEGWPVVTGEVQSGLIEPGAGN